ncbi:MAG: TonB-dependent receptor [Bacteroidales bacterium]
MKSLQYIIFCLTLMLSFENIYAQATDKKIEELTREEVLDLSYDELLEMPFEDLLKLADIVGVSLDELYEMILNKDLVSASKKVESSFNAPLSTSVISYQEIVNSGARSIEEALRLVPGLIVREKTNGNFDIHIRGNENLPPHHMFVYSENSITLVMIDGRPVYNYVHGGTFWETLPIGIEDVDRIEVVRGPSSALYGPNAVSGVVNIITKKQTGDNLSVAANVQAGNQNSLISSLVLGKKINKKLSFRASGNFETLDRNSDKLYVHKFNGKEWGLLSKQQLDTLRTFSPLEGSWFNVFDPTDDINEMYPNPYLARQRIGVNGGLEYSLKDDMNLNLKGGYQSSQVLSTTMGDNPTSMAGRVSNTEYIDFNARLKGLTAQVNLLTGWQDIVLQDTGFKVGIFNLNTNLEYDINIGNLSIRPGFAYQLGKYDDTPYLRYIGQGFLNGTRDFSSTALSLRAEYLLFERIRLVGAIRSEKYNTHKNNYWSYQAIASYNLNNRHNFRILYSQANRGPFLVDSYADYLWDRVGRPMPGSILFLGKENLGLLTMNMVEFGYRVKPIKSIQADFELFMNNTDNYSSLYPDSVNLNGFHLGTGRPFVRMIYQNIDMTSKQYGVSGNISWVPDKNIVIKLFGTYQKSFLYNVIPFSPDSAVSRMITEAFIRYQIDTVTTFSKNFPGDRVTETENHATPSFYGGLSVDVKVLQEKLLFSTNMYTYSAQIFQSKYSEKNIDNKVIINAKVSYKLLNNKLTLFVNARNIVSKKREFAYMDEIGRLFLIGLNFNL